MIRFDRVTKLYPGNSKPALDAVDVEIRAGEFVFLVGASGSGKSSFLRLVLKEEKPSSGEIHVLGQRLSAISNRKIPYFRRSLGVVFQDFRLLPNRNVYQNVAFTLQVIGKSRGFIQQAVPDVLRMVGLDGKAERLPHELSGGEQQRVAIARAVVNKPAILLADEPTGNLDPATSRGIMQVLELINTSGTTVVMATHDVGIVDSMKRRVIELVGGNIIRDEIEGGYTTAIPTLADEQRARTEERIPVLAGVGTVEVAVADSSTVPDYAAHFFAAPAVVEPLAPAVPVGSLPPLAPETTTKPGAEVPTPSYFSEPLPPFPGAAAVPPAPAAEPVVAEVSNSTPVTTWRGDPNAVGSVVSSAISAEPAPSWSAPAAAAPAAPAQHAEPADSAAPVVQPQAWTPTPFDQPTTSPFRRPAAPSTDTTPLELPPRVPQHAGPAERQPGADSYPPVPETTSPRADVFPAQQQALRSAQSQTSPNPIVRPADTGDQLRSLLRRDGASAPAPTDDDDTLSLAVRLGLRSAGAKPEQTSAQEIGPTS